jgi:hypothetical protein
MDDHLSAASLVNREAFRRTLKNSLFDVLGDLGGSLNASTRPSQQPFDSAALFQRSFTTRTGDPSSLLAQSLRINPNSARTQAPSLFANQFGHDSLLNQFEKHLFQARTNALLRQMVEKKRQQQSIQDAILVNLLQAKHREDLQSQLPQDNISVRDSLVIVERPLSLDAQAKAQKRKQNAYTLHALGNHLRSRHDPFIDCIDIADPNEVPLTEVPKSSSNRRSRGGVSEHFPERLHRMLLDVEDKGQSEIVSFFSHGRAFAVHDMDRFISEIMPKYFKQSKWNSFARQLNLYGFMRLSNGPDAGGYYHELFLQSRPSLSLHMRRVGVPQAQQDRRKCRLKNVAELQEPDFYGMKKSERIKPTETESERIKQGSC